MLWEFSPISRLGPTPVLPDSFQSQSAVTMAKKWVAIDEEDRHESCLV